MGQRGLIAPGLMHGRFAPPEGNERAALPWLGGLAEQEEYQRYQEEQWRAQQQGTQQRGTLQRGRGTAVATANKDTGELMSVLDPALFM